MIISSSIERLQRRPEVSGLSEDRVSRDGGRNGDIPIGDVCGTGLRSGEDGRQWERVVGTRPVAFCHVFLILEGIAVQSLTADGARECGHLVSDLWLGLVLLVSS